MKRSLCCLAAFLCAALSSATLIQVWNKTYSVNGFPTRWSEVVLDGAGNTYAVGTVDADDSDAVVIKISPAGSTLWTNRFTMPYYQVGNHIMLDNLGNLYVSYTTGSVNSDLVLRKMRMSDGGNLGSVTYADQLDYEYDTGALVMDESGQVYWTFQQFTPSTGERRAVISKINSTNLSASTTYPLRTPVGHGQLDCKPRPGGGILLLIGSSEFSSAGGFDQGRYFDSDLYTYAGSGVPTCTPMGLASRIVVNPSTGYVYGIGGGDKFGRLNIGRLTIGSFIDESYTATTYADTFIRSAIFTKNQFIVGAGSAGSDSFVTRFDSAPGLARLYTKTILGSADIEVMDSIKSDGFGGLSGVENVGFQTYSRIIEVDEMSGVEVDTRNIAGVIKGHAVNASGLIALGNNAGSVILLKPRDLKDIYMGSSSITGGNSGTLNIRMYEAYGSPRTVTLTEDGAHLSLPASKTVAGAASTASVIVTTTPVVASEVVTITAAYGLQQRIFKVTVNP